MDIYRKVCYTFRSVFYFALRREYDKGQAHKKNCDMDNDDDNAVCLFARCNLPVPCATSIKAGLKQPGAVFIGRHCRQDTFSQHQQFRRNTYRIKRKVRAYRLRRGRLQSAQKVKLRRQRGGCYKVPQKGCRRLRGQGNARVCARYAQPLRPCRLVRGHCQGPGHHGKDFLSKARKSRDSPRIRIRGLGR